MLPRSYVCMLTSRVALDMRRSHLIVVHASHAFLSKFLLHMEADRNIKDRCLIASRRCNPFLPPYQFVNES